MSEIKLDLRDILAIANENPNGTQITSPIKEYVNENGETVREFLLLAN